MRSLVLVLAIGCSSPSPKPKSESPPPPPTSDAAAVVAGDATDDRTVRFEGAITDLNFGCWADGDCGVEVDKIWVTSPGGMQSNPPPQGQIIGFSISGGPAEELKQQLIGKRVEVYAAKTPIWDATGNISGYDAKRLTLQGDANYYVRAK